MYDLATAQETKVLHEAFFVGKRLLCERNRYWFNTNGDQPARISSTAIFCPLCGDIWARRVILEAPFEWRVETRYCQKHGGGEIIDWLSIEGEQFLDPYHDDHFPKELYDYEFEVANSRP